MSFAFHCYDIRKKAQSPGTCLSCGKKDTILIQCVNCLNLIYCGEICAVYGSYTHDVDCFSMIEESIRLTILSDRLSRLVKSNTELVKYLYTWCVMAGRPGMLSLKFTSSAEAGKALDRIEKASRLLMWQCPVFFNSRAIKYLEEKSFVETPRREDHKRIMFNIILYDAKTAHYTFPDRIYYTDVLDDHSKNLVSTHADRPLQVI